MGGKLHKCEVCGDMVTLIVHTEDGWMCYDCWQQRSKEKVRA